MESALNQWTFELIRHDVACPVQVHACLREVILHESYFTYLGFYPDTVGETKISGKFPTYWRVNGNQAFSRMDWCQLNNASVQLRENPLEKLK